MLEVLLPGIKDFDAQSYKERRGDYVDLFQQYLDQRIQFCYPSIEKFNSMIVLDLDNVLMKIVVMMME